MLEEQIDLFCDAQVEGDSDSDSYDVDLVIPGRTERPSVTKGMVESWLREFFERNGIEIPKGFSKKNMSQMYGLYYGVLRKYHIREKNIISR